MAKLKNSRPDLLEVIRRAGIDTAKVEGRRQGNIRCAFHEDRGRPNMTVWTDTATWRCWRCGIGGDVYDFLGRLQFGNNWNPRDKTQFLEIIKKVEDDDIPRTIIKRKTYAQKNLASATKNVLGLASRVYHLALMGVAGKGAREYLISRKIRPNIMRELRLGYALPGALAGALAGYPAVLRKAAEEAGLFNADGKEVLAKRIVFSDIVRDTAGNQTVIHMTGRSLRPKAYLRYCALPGLPKTIYRLGMCNKNVPVILTESIIDTVNLWSMGFQGVGVTGTGIAYYLMTQLKNIPILAILPQNDEAGKKAVEKWMDELPQARLLNVSYRQDQKDLNDLVAEYGIQKTKQTLTELLKEQNIEY